MDLPDGVIEPLQQDLQDSGETVGLHLGNPLEGDLASIEVLNHWGRRKLAYPIKQQLEGNYVVTQLRLEPGRTKELEQGLRISEDVMRHLLVLADGR